MSETTKRNTIAVRTVDIIGQQLVHGSPLPEDNLYEDLGADSLDAVELRIEIEQELGIEINDEEFETWETVADVLTTTRKLTQ